MSYYGYRSKLLTIAIVAQAALAGCAGNAAPEDFAAGTTGSATTTQSTGGGTGSTQQFTLNANFTSTLVGPDWSNADTAQRFIADFNGDGLADLMALDPNWLYYSKNISTQFLGVTQLRDDFSAAKGWTSQSQTPRLFGDVNGDGKADIIGCGFNNLVVNTSDGTSTTGQLSFNAQTYFSIADGYLAQDTAPRFVADVNGDGKADLIGINPNGVRVGLSTGTTFGTPTVWSSSFLPSTGWTSQSATPRMFADADGDGKMDLIGFDPNGIYVALSTGTSFGTPTKVSTELGGVGWATDGSTPRFAADINGDGMADFIGIDADGVHVALGSGAQAHVPQPAEPSYIAYVGFQSNTADWSDQTKTPRFVADVNGDKKADFLGFSATGLEVVMAP